MAVAQHNNTQSTVCLSSLFCGEEGREGREECAVPGWGSARLVGGRGWAQRREKDTQEIEKEFLKANEGSHYGAWKRQGGMES